MNLNLKRVNKQIVISTMEVAKAFKKENHKIYPVIDDILAFDETGTAHRHFSSVITMGSRNQRYRTFDMTQQGFYLLCKKLKGLDIDTVMNIYQALDSCNSQSAAKPNMNIFIIA